MSWIDAAAIRPGIIEMLRVNMGLKDGEELLVVADVPVLADWTTKSPAILETRLERTMLARLVADIAAEHFTGCAVTFHPFPSTGSHGAEPDEPTAARMQAAGVVIALTTYSLSHTNAREAATEAGVRLASMPGFEAPMFEAGGPMAVDYRQVAADCQTFADLLTAAQEVEIRTPYGTDLRFSLAGRSGQVDTGLYAEPAEWGNLPAGETFAVPLEGTGQGQLVVPPGWHPHLTEDLIFQVRDGLVVEVAGGGAVGDEFRRLMQIGDDSPAAKARRNLAELGIGTNPNARKPDNVLEAEKIKGAVHIAFGDNIHMGGQVESDMHEDFVQPQSDLFLDGQPVIVNGRWQMSAPL